MGGVSKENSSNEIYLETWILYKHMFLCTCVKIQNSSVLTLLALGGSETCK